MAAAVPLDYKGHATSKRVDTTRNGARKKAIRRRQERRYDDTHAVGESRANAER